jgi:hypothetical protein
VYHLIKNLLPITLKDFLKNLLSKEIPYSNDSEIKQIRKSHKKIVRNLKKKEIINVIFLVIHDSIWKYEEVYKLFVNNPRFKVTIVIVPLVRKEIPDIELYEKTLNYFTKNNYQVFPSYDYENCTWKDIKSILNPDIVFFTNAHGITYSQYYINNFTDTLTCYVPYAFVVIGTLKLHYDYKIYQVLWKYFIETAQHLKFAEKYSKYNSSNLVVTGYPGLDRKFSNNNLPGKAWKPFLSGEAKKIIWAPHHTIKGQGHDLDYSSFMEYADYFIDLLKARNDIQIAFKPHPLLKEKLLSNDSWGKDKTNAYYNLWDELPNGQLEDGEYIDLFYGSDAMITDSASFIVEYLYFDKPLQFTLHDPTVIERFNTFGQKVFDYLYQTEDINGIEFFINDIVIGGNDDLRVKRNNFLKQDILPRNGKMASENIYNEIINELC